MFKGTGKYTIAVCSGKGGTGKTAVALSLAHTLGSSKAFDMPVRLLDCDVEAPNSHLFVSPNFEETITVNAGKPVWNMDACIGCGKCANKCHYNAIAMVKGKPIFFPDLCHSCGMCELVCPKDAIQMLPQPIGEILIDSKRQPFSFAMGKLKIGESLAPRVIQELKKYALPNAINILDGPPGSSCPAVNTITGSTAALLVTEPTRFGAHDLEITLKLCSDLKIPAGIVINRAGNDDKIIEDLSEEYETPIIGKIPFKREFAECCSRGGILSADYPELQPILISCFSQLVDLASDKKYPVRGKIEKSVVLHEKPIMVSHGHADYTEMTVLSGKGGTGKTTVTASLSALAKDRMFADCDVDASNLHLLMGGETWLRDEIRIGMFAEINEKQCIGCGKCAQACTFNAISKNNETGKYYVTESQCEGCGVCVEVCPVKAISEEEAQTGYIMASHTERGELTHADLGIGADNSGKLVTMVRNLALDQAKKLGGRWLLVDGPPGIACPVIASITGTDKVLIVTEPTIAGHHDLERILDLAGHFGLVADVIINKSDLNSEMVEKIIQTVNLKKCRIIGRIPFDETVNEALKESIPIVEYNDGPASKAIKDIWNKMKGE